MSRRRVVITGMGAVTPYGTADDMWQAFREGRSAITRIDEPWVEHVPVSIAGQVIDFDPLDYINRKEVRRISRPSQFAIAAAERALADAELTRHDMDGERVGVVMGTTMGPHLLAESMTSAYRANGHKRPNPVHFANCLPNMPAFFVSERVRALGPVATPIAACATGTVAIGDGTELIRSGRADVVFAGGVEAIIQDYIFAGFASMSALAEGYENCPEQASRPFSIDRSGFVLAEGCGILVLESMEHALARDANIHAEVIGHATSNDAYHIAAIDPTAGGMQRAMRWALEDAAIDPNEVDYINAHGSSTQPNDLLETRAIKTVFVEHAHDLKISSVKSMLGHAMAATGALEAISTVYTLQTGYIPPTINLYDPDPNCDLDYVTNVGTQPDEPPQIAMSNNFGLGGQNASVVLRRYDSR
ncbi:MAG: beta-ketoacyl-[acyl-carrier-protein] synthase family protein [Chloroflexota bacterium]